MKLGLRILSERQACNANEILFAGQTARWEEVSRGGSSRDAKIPSPRHE